VIVPARRVGFSALNRIRQGGSAEGRARRAIPARRPCAFGSVLLWGGRLVIAVRLPERREVPAEVQFEITPDTVTDTADLGAARLRTGHGQG
jgi:hypothetical protein